ncbi:MAG: carbohydrate-binding family 9-like protein [Sphaerochaetaceae bacterium]
MEKQPTLIIGNNLDKGIPVALLPCWGTYENTEGALRLAREGDILSLRYMMRSPYLRRMVQEHNQEVSEDSCVGLLLQSKGSEAYVHLQCSASKALRGWSIRGGERRILPVSLLETFSVAVTIVENSNVQSRWNLELSLDLKSLGLSLDRPILGNFYSCTEKTGQQYYLVANEIGTLAPNWEVPSSFLPLQFR